MSQETEEKIRVRSGPGLQKSELEQGICFVARPQPKKKQDAKGMQTCYWTCT